MKRVNDQDKFRNCSTWKRQCAHLRQSKLPLSAVEAPAVSNQASEDAVPHALSDAAAAAVVSKVAEAPCVLPPRQRSASESVSECSQTTDRSLTSSSGVAVDVAVSVEGSNPRYTPSPLSSGDDDRGNVTHFPMLEQALTAPIFNWNPEPLRYQGAIRH